VTDGPNARLKVTLISTVLNAAEHLTEFLDAVRAQTRAPDEVVIVDGGSTDGSAQLLRQAEGITLVDAAGTNIARGRNVALAHATHDVIAVADADCAYGPAWLGELLRPIEAGADVSMGWYRPIVASLMDACVTGHLPLEAAELDPATFLPSARSVAFRRDAIDAVGGYPEWLAIGEDMWVDLRWRERGFDLRLAPGAVAGWRPRPRLRDTWLQYFRYARGDAQAGMHTDRHALRSVAYAAGTLALASSRAWPKTLVAVAGAAYTRAQVRRTWRRLDGVRDKAFATMLVPAVVGSTDVAKMAGYGAGTFDRLTGRAGPAVRTAAQSAS
jgi:cellulose synthase/poly-beta-1,6-N-acetylglucosamine synthase-like glycosyltransferase